MKSLSKLFSDTIIREDKANVKEALSMMEKGVEYGAFVVEKVCCKEPGCGYEMLKFMKDQIYNTNITVFGTYNLKKSGFLFEISHGINQWWSESPTYIGVCRPADCWCYCSSDGQITSLTVKDV